MSGTSKKRASDGAGAPSIKRRKASIMSTTSGTHPLRQTSFPPDDSYDTGARSPSVDAMSFVSSSQVSTAAPVKKKRGRKSKAEKARLEREGSLIAGKANSTVGGRSEVGGAGGRSNAPGGGGEDGAEDDENIELDKDMRMAVTEDVLTEKEKEEWREKEQLLKNNFSEAQQNRYEQQRAVGLGKSTVRKVSLWSTSLTTLMLRAMFLTLLPAYQLNSLAIRARPSGDRDENYSKALHRRHD